MKYKTRRKLKTEIVELEADIDRLNNELIKQWVDYTIERAIADMYRFIATDRSAARKKPQNETLEREMDEFDKSLGKTAKKPKPDTWTSYPKPNAKKDPYLDPWYYKGDKFDTHRW